MIDKSVLKNMYRCEENFEKFACKSKDAIYFEKNDNDIRTEFARDVDKIVHSNSYTRYSGKTQVYTLYDTDVITKRMTHVQFVSRAARTISRALNLNEDLTEAIALSHDIGHAPFGHLGERILDEISKKELKRNFMHNVNGVRVLMNLENSGKGINISVQVLDGILCHNGEILSNKYYPNYSKTKDEFLNEYESSYINQDVCKKISAMTLEGCVVRVCDIIAYVGKDLEDAIKIGKIKREELPEDIKEYLGNNNSDIMNTIILDIIKNSMGKDYIEMSPKMFNVLGKLKDFNYKHIYEKAYTNKEKDYYKNAIYKLYYKYLEDLNYKLNKTSINSFIENKCKKYLKNNSNKQIVIDYISGMTDKFLISEYQNIIEGEI